MPHANCFNIRCKWLSRYCVILIQAGNASISSNDTMLQQLHSSHLVTIVHILIFKDNFTLFSGQTCILLLTVIGLAESEKAKHFDQIYKNSN